MENSPPAPHHNVGRCYSTIDPVKKQGILAELTRKENIAAELWAEKWGFLSQIRQIREEEAQNLGLSVEEYRAAIQSLNCQPEPKRYPVTVDPSPCPLPPTSTGMIGRRARCALERYGRLVKTARDYPIRPPLPPGQEYDPYKQTIIFLGIDVGDPISYKLPPIPVDVTDEMWARPQHLTVSPLADAMIYLSKS